MSNFEKATVVKKANLYFDGNVSSRTIILSSGEKVTLGIMLPGDYEFGTDYRETMEILGGEAKVLLPEKNEWETFREGSSFSVPAQSKFKITAIGIVDYCCSYHKD